jgi:hypothetical protein
MLEDYYVKPSTIDRVRSSWLAPQIESYLEWLQAHGYSRLVVYRCSFLFCGRAYPFERSFSFGNPSSWRVTS